MLWAKTVSRRIFFPISHEKITALMPSVFLRKFSDFLKKIHLITMSPCTILKFANHLYNFRNVQQNAPTPIFVKMSPNTIKEPWFWWFFWSKWRRCSIGQCFFCFFCQKHTAFMIAFLHKNGHESSLFLPKKSVLKIKTPETTWILQWLNLLF